MSSSAGSVDTVAEAAVAALTAVAVSFDGAWSASDKLAKRNSDECCLKKSTAT